MAVPLKQYHEVTEQRDSFERAARYWKDNHAAVAKERDKLKAEVEMLKHDGRGSARQIHGQAEKIRDLELQKDELRKVLSALVHSIEDTWHHIPPCDVGTERQHADTECVCGPDVEDALQVLFKTGKGAEKRVGD